jgi:hypothetical protein
VTQTSTSATLSVDPPVSTGTSEVVFARERKRGKRARPFEFVQREADANVLVLTNMWPEPTRAAYGIFVERQVHALKEAGVRCDVLYARGYLSKAVYVLGVPLMLWLSLATRRRYRAVHVHCGDGSHRSFLPDAPDDRHLPRR